MNADWAKLIACDVRPMCVILRKRSVEGTVGILYSLPRLKTHNGAVSQNSEFLYKYHYTETHTSYTNRQYSYLVSPPIVNCSPPS